MDLSDLKEGYQAAGDEPAVVIYMKKLLCYNIDETPFGQGFKEAVAVAGAEYISVPKDGVRKKISELLFLPELVPSLKDALMPEPDVFIHRRDMTEPLLLLYGFGEDEMNALFDLFKEKGLPRVRLTAVATPHNLQWSLRGLYQELSQEAAAMTKER